MPTRSSLRALLLVLTTWCGACFSDSPSLADDESSSSSSDSGDSDDNVSAQTLGSGDDGESTTESPDDTTSTSGGSEDASSDESSSSGDTPDVAPVAHWPFDGSAVDVGPDAHDGEIVGEPLFMNAVLGEGLWFDVAGEGRVELVPTATGVVEDPASFTVSGLYMASSWDGQHNFWTLGKPGEGLDTNAVGLQVLDGVLRMYIETGDLGEDTFVDLGPAPELDQWHRYTTVVDESSVLLYVDDQQRGPFAIPIPDTTSPDFVIGGWWSGSFTFAGAVDELVIMGRPLSADDVATLPSP